MRPTWFYAKVVPSPVRCYLISRRAWTFESPQLQMTIVIEILIVKYIWKHMHFTLISILGDSTMLICKLESIIRNALTHNRPQIYTFLSCFPFFSFSNSTSDGFFCNKPVRMKKLRHFLESSAQYSPMNLV